jgi:threonine synthase
VKYVSTRGEAPVLGFEDALLAGLARDGGLYVPETWPVFSPDQIAGMAGRPYHEVAVEVMSPFVGGAIDDAALAGMAQAWRGRINTFISAEAPARTIVQFQAQS